MKKLIVLLFPIAVLAACGDKGSDSTITNSAPGQASAASNVQASQNDALKVDPNRVSAGKQTDTSNANGAGMNAGASSMSGSTIPGASDANAASSADSASGTMAQPASAASQ